MTNDESTKNVSDDVASILAELEAEIAEETVPMPELPKPGGRKLTMLSRGGAPPVPPIPTLGGGPSAPSGPSGERRVMEGNLVAAEAPEAVADGVVRVIGQVSEDETECTLMISQNLLNGFSWYFGSEEEAQGSPLAEQLMALPHVSSVLMDESTIVLGRAPRIWDDWQPIAADAGAAIRAALSGELEMVSTSIQESVPSEETLAEQVQLVLDNEVNPGVAAHSGHITLERIRGNSVYIKMGGGCQGCSVADVTLKQGIHTSFREAIQGIGAIYDETDHSAGLNPYFS